MQIDRCCIQLNPQTKQNIEMRPVFMNILLDPTKIEIKRQLLAIEPISQQQYFIQILGNLQLLHNQEEVGEISKHFENYKGSYSFLVLMLKYLSYSMEKKLNQNYHQFPLIKMLTKWVDIYEGLKKKKQILLYPAVVGSLDKSMGTYEEFISYLNYISLDLMGLLKSGSEETRKNVSETNINSHTHLNSHDLIEFLKVILPKILSNLAVPRTFFPQTLLRSKDEFVDILYSQQNIEALIHTKKHYIVLLRTIIKILLSLELPTSQSKDLVLCSFNYFYLFHQDKSYGASQIVIQSLKKMTSAVRYALHDDIMMFFRILKKLGKDLFINYLSDKFVWIAQISKDNTIAGINKSTVKPLKLMNNSQQIKIEPRKTVHLYLEIYDRFSLIYFSLNCLEHDINIRFYYLGDFTKAHGDSQNKILFGSEKKGGSFEGSIQAVEKGIYMFELDNSYSWVKSKTVSYDVSILVPIQIRQHKKNLIKQIIFEKHTLLNELPYENIIGWVDDNQIKISSSSGKVSQLYCDDTKIYNLKLIKNTGSIYEYQSQSKFRFMKKIQKLAEDANIFWLIQQCRVEGIQKIRQWLDGNYKPRNLYLASQESTKANETVINEKEEEEEEIIEEKYENISSGSDEDDPSKQKELTKSVEQQQIQQKEKIEQEERNPDKVAD